jgi:small subunit ribosomal protein S27Ae
VKQSDFFSLKEGKLERKGRICNRCGEGTFMAEHEDRFYCGKCGLTIWKENKSQKT